MQIGTLAKIAGCQVVTIRYYEKIGLMPPPSRTNANYRDYGREAVERLLFIRHCRRHGMSIKEVAELVRLEENPAGSCKRVHDIVNGHITNIDRQIDELNTLKASLLDMLKKCHADGDAPCGILDGLRDTETCVWCGMCDRGQTKKDHREMI